MTLGQIADKLYELKAKRAKIQAEADKIEEKEKALKEVLIQSLSKDDAQGVLGKVGRAREDQAHGLSVATRAGP